MNGSVCLKIGYRSQKRAENAKRNKHPATHHGLVAYECEKCGKWHLGHKGKPFGLLLRQAAQFRDQIQRAKTPAHLQIP